MNDDRTQHVIDAIDGALGDWTVGPDAMRWTPEPEAAEGPPASASGGPLRWQPTLVGASVEHRPGCSIVHEYLGRPPACQCGALERAARQIQLPPSALSIAPAGTAPGAGGWIDISDLIEDAALTPAARQAAALARSFGVTFRQAAESMARVFAVSADDVARMLVTLEDLRPLAPEGPDPEDPRARALRLRRERNTGPGQAPAGRQKRPRWLQ